MLYGGSIAPGRWRDHDVTILDVFEAIGAHAAGEMSTEDLHDLEGVAGPAPAPAAPVHRQHHGLRSGAGDLAGRVVDGAAEDDEKDTVAEKIGELVIRVLAEDLRPSRVVTHRSRTRSRACARPAARPTASCICSPSPARRGWSSRSTTSSGSPGERRCSRT